MGNTPKLRVRKDISRICISPNQQNVKTIESDRKKTGNYHSEDRFFYAALCGCISALYLLFNMLKVSEPYIAINYLWIL